MILAHLRFILWTSGMPWPVGWERLDNPKLLKKKKVNTWSSKNESAKLKEYQSIWLSDFLG